MQSWDNYQRVKRRADEALTVLGYIGKPCVDGVGRLHLLSVNAIIHYQPGGVVKDHHGNQVLNDALAEAALEIWPQLRDRAVEILTASCAEALAATRTDLEAALAEIDALERPAS